MTAAEERAAVIAEMREALGGWASFEWQHGMLTRAIAALEAAPAPLVKGARELIELLNDLNAAGDLRYDVYSTLHDAVSLAPAPLVTDSREALATALARSLNWEWSSAAGVRSSSEIVGDIVAELIEANVVRVAEPVDLEQAKREAAAQALRASASAVYLGRIEWTPQSVRDWLNSRADGLDRGKS